MYSLVVTPMIVVIVVVSIVLVVIRVVAVTVVVHHDCTDSREGYGALLVHTPQLLGFPWDPDLFW